MTTSSTASARGPATPTGPLLVRVRAVLPALAPAEQRVANAVLADPAGVAAMTISELGVPGYPQLRLQLAAQSAQSMESPEVGGDIEPGDSLADVVAKVAYADERAVKETAQQLDPDALAKVVAAVAGAPRVDIYGLGASAFVAMDLQQKLHRIRRVSFAWSDAHIALTSAAFPQQRGARQRDVGEGDVAITNYPRSPVAQTAQLLLTTAARETAYRSGAMASRIAQLMVVDCLFIGVAQQVLPDARKALETTYTAVRGHHLKHAGE